MVGGLLFLDLLAVLVSGGQWSLTGSAVGNLGVAVRLLLLAGLGIGLYRSGRWKDGYQLALVLLMLASVYHFHATGRRMVGDGYFYYAYVQSFWKDFDVHFENEYGQYGVLERPSIETPTRTGYRRNIFSVGPAVLWSPFFGLGELFGRVAAWSGLEVNLRGDGLFHWKAVSLGTLLYGFAALILVQSLLRRYFSKPVAFAATVLMWLSTSFYWYTVQQPTMAHGLATFTGALFLWFWDRNRLGRGLRSAFVLGLIGGLTVCVRWQNGLLLVLPFLDWLWAIRRRDGAVVAAGPVLLVGVFIAVLPQLLAWQAIYGQFLFLHAPQGRTLVRFHRPFVWETLFSSRHGLLTWTPVLWLGFLGLLPLLRRGSATVWMMTFCLLLMTYVNMSAKEWWAGGAFSGRRFDASLPILAFGIAMSFELLGRFAARRPALMAGALLAFFPLWNFLFMDQYRLHRIPSDNTVSFTQVASNSAEILFDKVGYPFAWPLNWWYGWRHGMSFSEYDTVVGRYFFYINRVRAQVMEIGEDDGGLIGEGWNPPEFRVDRWVRVTRRKEARLFVPLERAEKLQLTFRLSVRPQPVEVIVEVNGREVGRFLAAPGFTDYALPAPIEWQKGINTLVLRPQFTERAQILLLDRVSFQRVGA